ncbi:MAG: hypothetical protein HUU23_08820 [Caldilineales bacterium]|nr:hypothetical protein [Caldilineales bacterium]
MSYLTTIRTLGDDAEQLEMTYQTALKAGEAAAFKEAIDATYAAAPNHLLYAAWHHRLTYAAAKVRGFAIAWGWAIPLALLNALLFWWLSDDAHFMVKLVHPTTGDVTTFLPTLLLLIAPIAAACMLIYLAAVSGKGWGRSALAIGGVAIASFYVLWVYPQTGSRPFQEQYLGLMAMHLPLLAWAGVGLTLLPGRRRPADTFAFLIKSLEVLVMAGLFMAAGVLFIMVTFGLFSALDVTLSTLVQRLFIAGGGGLVPVLALAVIYNPTLPPAAQSFDEGLSKLVALLLRVLLPLTLLVLLIYIGFIPFNFRQPFENRDVLIIYNGMLFAVIALLLGATPLAADDLAPAVARWLRRGIIALAALALLVGVYAFAAILYRTAIDKLTPNRLAFIGWNVVNIGLLILLLALQARGQAAAWLQGVQRAFSIGAVTYTLWAVAVILLLPWLFGMDQGRMEALPPAVQRIVYEQTPPILLKCASSPHIYQLDGGEKRWIQDIPTFQARGFVWRDVRILSCDALRSLPDGPPIPADAGPPPQP